MNIKNNFIKFFILVLFFLFSFSSKVVASVVLTTSNLSSGSVILQATGLTPPTGNNIVVFTLLSSTNNPNTIPYYSKEHESTVGSGNANSLFSGLTSGAKYTASIHYKGQNATLATISFFTPQITTSDLSATAVTLNATGLIPNKEVSFKLISTDAIGLYNKTFILTISSSGTASAVFSDPPLLASYPYKGTIFYTNKSSMTIGDVIFTTPSGSSYTALLTPLNITENSVTLMAENLTKNTSVTVGVVNKNRGGAPYSVYYKKFSDDKGKVFVDFTGLSSGEEYTGSVYYGSSNKAVGSIDFRTKGGIIVQVGEIKDTSVAITLKNFPPNKKITFKVYGYDYKTPTDPNDPNLKKEITTSSTGGAHIYFSGLIPGGHYKYLHSESPNTGSFYTTGNAQPPSNTGNSGNSNPENGTTDLIPCIDNCGFYDLLNLINKAMKFIIIALAVPVAAIMFAYAGFLLVFSAGAPEERTKAKKIFINVAIGLACIVGAWVIVHTILSMMGYNQSIDWFGL